MKTLLYRDEPVPLYEFYVPLTIRSKRRVVHSAGMKDVAQLSRRLVITGSAGMGKSTLLKHLFIDAIRTRTTIPIFIELRQLNNAQQDLVEFIVDTIQSNQVHIGKEYIEKGFESGKFTLMLDAYDELTIDLRENIRKSLFAFCTRYPQTPVIISSRPDDEFIAWQQFTEFSTQPLTRQQAVQLVTKLRFDPEVKKRFTEELVNSFYTDHESFASNPLLLTIMLITFSVNAAIPRKKHVFYEQVFQVLFNQHDATKEAGYRRQTATKMAVDDFQRVLAAFAVQTLIDHKLTFSRPSCIKYLATAKEMTGLTFEEEHFFTDLIKAVCLIVQDGIEFTYTHKQFQEYFTAEFINHTDPAMQKQLVSRSAPDLAPNDVLRLLFDMNPELVERLFILPGITKILKQVNYDGTVTDGCFVRFWQLQVKEIHWASGSMRFHTTGANILSFCSFVASCYNDRVAPPKPTKPTYEALKAVQTELQTIFSGEKEHVLSTKSLAEYPDLVRALKSYHLLGIDSLRYLVEVKGFIDARKTKRSNSLKHVLAARKAKPN